MAATDDDLRARALRLLARREHSRQELAAKLRCKPAPPWAKRSRGDEFASDPFPSDAYKAPTENEVNALLDDLEQRKMLSDNRYAEVRVRLKAPRYGDNRLRQELTQKGIDRDTIAAVLSEQPDEIVRCHQLWLRKFGQHPRDMNEHIKQTRYLANRGFTMRVIQQVIHGESRTSCETSCDNSDIVPDA